MLSGNAYHILEEEGELDAAGTFAGIRGVTAENFAPVSTDVPCMTVQGQEPATVQSRSGIFIRIHLLSSVRQRHSRELGEWSPLLRRPGA